MSPAAKALDADVRAATAFNTFAELVAATVRDGYEPTIYRDRDPGYMRDCTARVADAFDAEMARLGRSERAWPRVSR